jgi:hypothetical protein
LNFNTAEIRRHIFNQTEIAYIVHYGRAVFPKVTVDTEVIIVRKTTPEPEHAMEITVTRKDGSSESYLIPQAKWQAGNGAAVNILEKPDYDVLSDKIKRHPVLDTIGKITQGAKPFQVGKGKPKQTREIVQAKPFVSETVRDSTFRPLLRGSLIQRYQILWNNNYYLSFGDWLAEPRYSADYDAPVKIVIRQTGDSLIATLDRQQFIARDNLYTIVSKENGLDLRYILGLLNSRLLNWYYQNVMNPEAGEALAQVKRGHLAQLPIAVPNSHQQQNSVNNLVQLVEQCLLLNKQVIQVTMPHEKTILQRQIEATNRQIDQLVYELYELTAEEIAIVEGGR